MAGLAQSPPQERREAGATRASDEKTERPLLLKRPHVGDERLDLIVVQLVLEGLHLLLRPILQAFFDRGEHFIVLQASLVLRVGLVLDTRHAAGFGLALAVLAM